MSFNLDDMDEEVQKKFMNFQNLQQQLDFHNNSKIQLETSLRETELAIEELEKASPETVVYKKAGGILVKSERNKLLGEKKSQKVTLEMNIKTLEQKLTRTKSQLEAVSKSIQADLQNKQA